MSQTNVEIVRVALQASSDGDANTFLGALDSAIEWKPVIEDPDHREHRGLPDVAAWLAEWSAVFPDMRWKAERVVDAGPDKVLALVRALGRGEATGAQVETPVYAVAFTLRHGKIVRIDESPDKTSLKAVGLEE